LSTLHSSNASWFNLLPLNMHGASSCCLISVIYNLLLPREIKAVTPEPLP